MHLYTFQFPVNNLSHQFSATCNNYRKDVTGKWLPNAKICPNYSWTYCINAKQYWGYESNRWMSLIEGIGVLTYIYNEYTLQIHIF